MQLELIVGGLDPARWRADVVLPAAGTLAERLRALGAEVRVRPSLAVLRREHLAPRGPRLLLGRVRGDVAALGAGDEPPALVHANTSAVLSAIPLARALAVPVALHVREFYADVAGWPLLRRRLERADRLLCVSEAVRAQFSASVRARVLHDGLPPTPARPEREAARRELGLPADAFAVALVGRLSSWKGQDVLLDALAEVPRGVGLLAGDEWRREDGRDGGLRAALERRAGTLGVDARFLGFRPDPGPVLAAADVVVVPSTRPDPLPNAALEAAAAGCCVVAAGHGGLPEILEDGRTGVLVAPGDPRALACALRELGARPDVRRELGAAAAADVRKRFAPARLHTQVGRTYDELAPPPHQANAPAVPRAVQPGRRPGT